MQHPVAAGETLEAGFVYMDAVQTLGRRLVVHFPAVVREGFLQGYQIGVAKQRLPNAFVERSPIDTR
ncbi:MAG TPA: hypothetical protein VFV23_13795 [Verrucomicrobiae bacterium]|nr:hypothetical protein [Verrucomicrobiae bacterium]